MRIIGSIRAPRTKKWRWNFIYKKKFHIKTINGEGTYTVISKSYDYLLTIDGEKILIKNIINIEEA